MPCRPGEGGARCRGKRGGRSASQSQRQRHWLWRRLLWRHHQNRPRVSVCDRKRRLSDEETEYERPSSRPRTETPEPEPEDPIDELVDVALTNMSRFASNRMNWARIFGVKITFQPQSELGVGATTAKVMVSGNLKKVWRFMAHLEYTFPNTFPKKESSEESGSPSPTIESRVRNGEMGSFKMDDTRCLTPEDEEHID